MILFRKDSTYYLRNFNVAVDFKSRAYCEYPYLSNLIYNTERAATNAFEWNENTLRKGFPQYILKYYRGAGHVIGKDSPKRRACTSDMGNAVLLPIDDLKKYEITRAKGEQLLNFISQHVPNEFIDLPEDVVKLFCHKLEDEAEYCMKYMFFFATEKIVERCGYGDYWLPSRYLITDANMNPIDVNEFMDVMSKILVDK